MWRFVVITFLVGHGLMHLAVWIAPARSGARPPFDPSRSWLLGDRIPLASTAALVACGLLIAAGLGLWAHAGWWRGVAIAGLATSFVLMVVYFRPWFLVIQSVNLALIIWLSFGRPSRAVLGA